jgi:hypothetical protein
MAYTFSNGYLGVSLLSVGVCCKCGSKCVEPFTKAVCVKRKLRRNDVVYVFLLVDFISGKLLCFGKIIR